jgi:serine/threonine protein kinase
MIHYDIKPDNILVSKDDILKFTDFGTSISLPEVLITDEIPARIKGTPIYHRLKSGPNVVSLLTQQPRFTENLWIFGHWDAPYMNSSITGFRSR